MYKVFMNDKPIIVTDSPQKELGFKVYDFESVVIDEILHKLKKKSVSGVILFCKDLESSWKKFLDHFSVISAAGGLVTNKQHDILFIYRGRKWDLPKGRIEKNESIENTAIREVEEECGITNLSIRKFLLTTYHLFYQNKKNKLKETHWFLMDSDYQGTLTPQTEEGITKVVFKNREESQEALKNTYANIHLVLQSHLQN